MCDSESSAQLVHREPAAAQNRGSPWPLAGSDAMHCDDRSWVYAQLQTPKHEDLPPVVVDALAYEGAAFLHVGGQCSNNLRKRRFAAQISWRERLVLSSPNAELRGV